MCTHRSKHNILQHNKIENILNFKISYLKIFDIIERADESLSKLLPYVIIRVSIEEGNSYKTEKRYIAPFDRILRSM